MNGQLGNHSTLEATAAVMVDMSGLDRAGPILFGSSSSAASHNIAVVAGPAPELSAIDIWRSENFGIAAMSSGDADDCADCDHDGIANLVEYAFGLDPNENSAGELPQPRRVGDQMVIEFSKPADVSGVVYGAEWSPDLEPGNWKEIPNSGSGDNYTFSMPTGTSPNLFLRLKVRTP